MLYKTVFLAILLIVNITNLSADNQIVSRQLLQDDLGDDTGDDAVTESPTDATSAASADGTDGTDSPIDWPSFEDVTDSPDTDTTEIESIESAETTEVDSNDSDDSDDSVDSTQGPSDSGSESDSNGSDTESQGSASVASNGSNGSNDSNESTDESNDSNDSNESNDSGDDDCTGFVQSECEEQTDDDGFADCAYNTVTNECYGVTEREGRFGSGNFDDGYNAAKAQSTQESNQLTTLVGVLGGIIGALVLIIGGGGYYFYKQTKDVKQHLMPGIEMANDGQTMTVDDNEAMVIHTVEDVSPVITKGDNDTDPMLS